MPMFARDRLIATVLVGDLTIRVQRLGTRGVAASIEMKSLRGLSQVLSECQHRFAFRVVAVELRDDDAPEHPEHHYGSKQRVEADASFEVR